MTMRSSPAALAAIVLVLAVAVAGCGGDDGGGKAGGRPAAPPITIGTKDFTEQYILGELYRQALAAKGFKVRLKSDIGSSEIVDRALTAGSLDVYPEYTGVLLSEIAGRHREPRSATEAYRTAKAFEAKRGFTLTAMTPFSDSNALAATPAFARRHRLRTIADLDNVPRGAVVGAPPEFRTRFEGLVGLQRVYRLMNVRVRPFKIGEQYAALDRGKVGVAAVFTTDGQLVSRRYTILRDPRRLFAFQNVAPVVRRSLLSRYPEIGRVLDSVSAKLTTKAMRKMNAAAVQRGEKPAAVAARFLRDNGLAGH
jgi:osmoprotectant transport system substrate-binding protein